MTRARLNSPAAIALLFALAHPPEIAARYNIAPTQPDRVIRTKLVGNRELAELR